MEVPALHKEVVANVSMSFHLFPYSSVLRAGFSRTIRIPLFLATLATCALLWYTTTIGMLIASQITGAIDLVKTFATVRKIMRYNRISAGMEFGLVTTVGENSNSHLCSPLGFHFITTDQLHSPSYVPDLLTASSRAVLIPSPGSPR